MSDPNEILLDLNHRAWCIFYRSLCKTPLPEDAEEMKEIKRQWKELEKKYDMPPINWRYERFKMLKELREED